MARSHGVVKTEIWEPTNDLRQRTLAAQWTYLMLISQPQINNCGIVPYVPEKWVRYAADLHQETLLTALDELETQRFVVIDQDAGELLVRTFVKHDRIWRQPNLITSARKQHREIESERIRRILGHLHPWLEDTRHPNEVRAYEESRPAEPLPEPLFTEGVPRPLSEGVHEGVSEPLPEGVNARTRVPAGDPHVRARPRPLPQPQPQRDPPQEDLSLGTNGSPARATSASAGRAALDIALDRIRNIGAELPPNDLEPELRDALGDRYHELTDDDLVELRDLHADLAGETT